MIVVNSAHHGIIGGGAVATWGLVEGAIEAGERVTTNASALDGEFERVPSARGVKITPVLPAGDQSITVSIHDWPQATDARRHAHLLFYPVRDDAPPAHVTDLWAISQFTAEAAATKYGISVPPVWELWPHAADHAPRPKEKIVLNVGRFFSQPDGVSKSQMVLIEAFKRLQRPDWQMVCIGAITSPSDADYFNRCIQLAAGDLLPDGRPRVLLLPNLSYPTTADYFRRASIYAHAMGMAGPPSAVEHWGVVYAKAFQAGCRVIGHRSGAATVDFRGHMDTFTTVRECVERLREAMDAYTVDPVMYPHVKDHADTVTAAAHLVRGLVA